MRRDPVVIGVALLVAATAGARAQEGEGLPRAHLRCVTFSPDGKLLATGSGEPDERGEVVVWDVAARKVLWSHAEGCGVPGLAFAPDGKSLAVGVFADVCRLRDAATGKEVLALPGHGKAARAVAFSPDGRLLAVGTYDKQIHLWDLPRKQKARVLDGHTDWVYCVAFTPDGARLASSSADRTVRLWDVAPGKEQRKLADHDSIVRCVALGPRGRWLVAPCWDGTARLHDLEAGKVLADFGRVGGIDWAALSPDGKQLVLVHSAYTWFDVFRPGFRPPTPAEEKAIGGLIGGLDDDSAAVRDKAAAELEAFGLLAEPSLHRALKESPSAEVRMRARRLRAEARKPRPAFRPNGHDEPVTCAAFAPDGRYLATTGKDRAVVLWDAATWERAATLRRDR